MVDPRAVGDGGCFGGASDEGARLRLSAWGESVEGARLRPSTARDRSERQVTRETLGGQEEPEPEDSRGEGREVRVEEREDGAEDMGELGMGT